MLKSVYLDITTNSIFLVMIHSILTVLIYLYFVPSSGEWENVTTTSVGEVGMSVILSLFYSFLGIFTQFMISFNCPLVYLCVSLYQLLYPPTISSLYLFIIHMHIYFLYHAVMFSLFLNSEAKATLLRNRSIVEQDNKKGVKPKLYKT